MTDEVSKIEFPKMAHIAQLVYETGWNVANLDHFPARDNKGPRDGESGEGRGTSQKVEERPVHATRAPPLTV